MDFNVNGTLRCQHKQPVHTYATWIHVDIIIIPYMPIPVRPLKIQSAGLEKILLVPCTVTKAFALHKWFP